ncbi:hypothetical protein ABC733_27630 [Mangrovibacter sp. SLW1]
MASKIALMGQALSINLAATYLLMGAARYFTEKPEVFCLRKILAEIQISANRKIKYIT